jgi:hypothetical protein
LLGGEPSGSPSFGPPLRNRRWYLGEPPVLPVGVPDPWRPAPHLDQTVDDLIEL